MIKNKIAHAVLIAFDDLDLAISAAVLGLVVPLEPKSEPWLMRYFEL